MEISQRVKDKLAEALEIWRDETLIGKPEILGYMVYSDVCKLLQERTDEINETFKD